MGTDGASTPDGVAALRGFLRARILEELDVAAEVRVRDGLRLEEVELAYVVLTRSTERDDTEVTGSLRAAAELWSDHPDFRPAWSWRRRPPRRPAVRTSITTSTEPGPRAPATGPRSDGSRTKVVASARRIGRLWHLTVESHPHIDVEPVEQVDGIWSSVATAVADALGLQPHEVLVELEWLRAGRGDG